MFDIRLASLEAFGRSIFDIVDQANLERARSWPHSMLASSAYARNT